MTKLELFKELAKPDKKGFSRPVLRKEFVGKYKSLYTENGLSWGRQDSFPYLLELKREGKKIVSYQCVGFNKVPDKTIKKEIKDSILKKRCLLLGTKYPEADHKNGRYNNPRVNNKLTQRKDDFQPLGQAANKAKRQICKTCKATNKRFDAKILGFEKSFLFGDSNYLESPDGCIGCFWYDVREFQKNIKII